MFCGTIFCGIGLASAQAPPEQTPEVPPVQMTEKHRKLVLIKEGDAFPNFELPQVGGKPAEANVAFSKLRGKAATVVLVWEDDHWMTQAALSDLAKDIPRLFGKKGVAVVGIAVNQDAATAQQMLAKQKIDFSHLADPEGKAVQQLTKAELPHVYALGPDGKVAWFDIEYSEASRRELRQTLEALTQE